MTRTLIFCCLFCFAQTGMAQVFIKTTQSECTSLDLRTSQLHQIRDQKKLSWCYAFTAADMLSYAYDLSEPISAADVAIHYNASDLGLFSRWLRDTFGQKPSQDNQDDFMMPHQTGFNKVALDRAIRDGHCPERVFPSETWVKMTNVHGRWLESKTDLKTAMIDIYSLLKNQAHLTASNIPYYFHFKNVESAEAFYVLLKGETTSSFYSKLRNQVCRDDRISFSESYKVQMSIKDGAAFATLNRQLNKGRLVGIDYDARVLSDSRNQSIRISELHTSAIVARRWSARDQQCQYLIHDSHGDQCTRYDASYECLGGQVWIDESKIYNNLLSFVYVMKK